MSGAEPPSIDFDQAARDELAQAVAWYDQQAEGLGDRFLADFKKTIGRIRDFPNAWQQLSSRSRRCRLKRFPYGVMYQVVPGQIRIIAVGHLHREPDYWKSREQ